MDLKFIILAPPRSASTLLCHALNHHPSLSVERELFHPFDEEMLNIRKRITNIDFNVVSNGAFSHLESNYFDRYINDIFDEYNGFKLLYTHLTRDIINSLPNIKFIILKRNILHCAVSFMIAVQTNKWQYTSGYMLDKNFNLDCGKLKTIIDRLEQTEEIICDKFDNSIVLRYDDLIKNWNDELMRTSNFLEIENVSLPQVFNKGIVNSYRSIIRNYDEICSNFPNYDF